tara:strand:+ start:142 stop:1107 length:966 start_codon:yes stop_codon:yes gene_type:complete
MKILITGVAGFIGFSLAENLLKNKKKITIYGIDNLDNYYSVKYKKKRLDILKKHKNFIFEKIDITNRNKIFQYFKNKKFNQVYHFAAQAGVRYSLINPKKYLDVNLYGFINIMDNLVKNKPDKFVYASSSSVYGDLTKFPLKENFILNPKNIYGYTKMLNERIASYYFKVHKIPSIGLRFFTIFGVWGRPDMFIIKLLNSINNRKFFKLNNSGDHYRDFTSIKFVLEILNLIIKKKIYNHQVFNISSSKPINIKKLVKTICNKENSKFIKNVKKHPADVYKTHGSNLKIKKYLGIKKNFNFKKDLQELIHWYKKNKIYNIS